MYRSTVSGATMTAITRREIQRVLYSSAKDLLPADTDGDDIITRVEANARLALLPAGPEKDLAEAIFVAADTADGLDGRTTRWNLQAAATANLPKRTLEPSRLPLEPRHIQLAAAIARRTLAEAPSTLVGTLALDGKSALVFTASDGRIVPLVAPTMKADHYDVSPSWMAGFVGDGPVTLQGTMSKDGRAFEVEGFALNVDGQYNSFTFGRVNADSPDDVFISTPRGDVEIGDPILKAKLRALPRLAVILPGACRQTEEASVYDGNPSEFYGLARFNEVNAAKDATALGAPGKKYALGDMAWSALRNKPLIFPAEYASRSNMINRIWLRGNLNLDAAGQHKDFTATYVSQATDNKALAALPTTG
jgi:hypothetical protein